MLTPITEFFNQIEARQCTHCGSAIEEQADCYTVVCATCEEDQFFPVFPKLKRQLEQ